MRPMRRPIRIMPTMEPKPRGLMARPLLKGGVAQQGLQKERQQRDGAVEDGAHDGHERGADEEVAVAQDAQIDQGMIGHELAEDKQDQAGDAGDQEGADEGGAEPVFLLAFVEDDLEASRSTGPAGRIRGVDAAGAWPRM